MEKFTYYANIAPMDIAFKQALIDKNSCRLELKLRKQTCQIWQ